MVTKKTYRVLNPRNIEPHIRVICGEYQGVTYEWFEGDVFDPPPGMQKADIDWLIHTHLIEEVIDG